MNPLRTALLLLVANVCLHAQQPVLVTTPYGNFDISASISTEKYLGQKLTGTIVNHTSRNWKNLEFAFSYYDAGGNKVDVIMGDSVHVFGQLKIGESASIGVSDGQRIFVRRTGQNEPVITRWEASFKDGTVIAAYTFSLLKKTAAKSGKPVDTENEDLRFSDESVTFLFSISKGQLGFVLQNLTDEPIEIDWNKVSYVDVEGESHKVMHTGVKYSARNEPLAPTTVPPSAKLEDIVFPTDYVYYSEGQYGGWRETPFFPDGEKASAYKGRTFLVFMPLRLNGVVKNYSFKFKVADVLF